MSSPSKPLPPLAFLAIAGVVIAAVVAVAADQDKQRDAKAAAERRANEEAARDAAALKVRKEAQRNDGTMALVAFRSKVEHSNNSLAFRDAALDDDSPTTLRVRVTGSFGRLAKHDRLDAVQSFAVAWSQANAAHCSKGCMVLVINDAGRQVGRWDAMFGAEVEE